MPQTFAPLISQPVPTTKPEPAWQPIEFDIQPELPKVSTPAKTDSDSSFEDQIIADALAEDALADNDVSTAARVEHALTEDDLVEHPTENPTAEFDPEEFLVAPASNEDAPVAVAPVADATFDEVTAENVIADNPTADDPVIEAELLPATPFANRVARPSAFAPTTDQFAEPAAQPTGFSTWLRSRPKWFWVAVVVGWLIAAAVIASVKTFPSTRSADEWELIRKAYLKKEAEKAATQLDAANPSPATADGAKDSTDGAKNPADSSAK